MSFVNIAITVMVILGILELDDSNQLKIRSLIIDIRSPQCVDNGEHSLDENNNPNITQFI